MASQRRFFRPRDAEVGRHQSFRQPLDGEYAFRLDQGGQAPLDTYNAATKELQEIIGECLRDGTTLRARGSLWSLSQVAVTDGRLIDTKALRQAFSFPPVLIDPRYTAAGGNPARLRLIECGNSIDAVSRYLFGDRLSLKASGSNNGQTLAGALSTGTHGSAFKVGAIQEMAVGLHLVVGPGKHVYLERNSQPVMKPDFARSLGAEFLQDDDLFNAALISFGSFGVIHGMMVEARELFILNAIRFNHPYDDALKRAVTTLDLSGLRLPASAAAAPKDKPYHFEIFYNPNEGTPPAEAIVLVMFEEPFDESYVPPEWDASDAGPGASGLDVMGTLLEIIPQPLTPLVVKILNDQVRDQYAPMTKKGVIRDLFRGEKTQGKTLGCGIGLPLPRALEGLEIAFRTYRHSGDVMPIILSHRFVKGTQALLGFTRFDPTAVLEIDAINTPGTRKYLQTVWADLDAAGIPFTLHWGKFNSFLTPSRVRKMYGDAAVDRWIASRNGLLESPEVAKVFANPFITRLQLAG
jgi:hypothetical protein